MEFERLEWDAEAKSSQTVGTVFLPADDVILAIGQENAFPGSSATWESNSISGICPSVDPTTYQSTRPGVFFGGDAAFGPKNIIWAVEHGHQAAISIHNHCQGAVSPSGPRTA